MDQLVISGNCKLSGVVKISKAKNSSLPILIACLLNPNKVTLNELPDLRDISTTLNLLKNLQAQFKRQHQLGLKILKHQ